MKEWISVKNRLPEEKEEVVIHLTDGSTEYAMRFKDDDGDTGWIGINENMDCEWVILDGTKMAKMIDFWLAEKEEPEEEEYWEQPDKAIIFDMGDCEVCISIKNNDIAFHFKGTEGEWD